VKSTARTESEQRLLVLAPTAKDAEITASVMSATGIAAVVCTGVEQLLGELAIGAACVLIAEEAVTANARIIEQAIARQPAWSDLPILIITRHGADSPTATQASRTLGNVTLLERPTRLVTLISAVSSALRARERQYELRDHIEKLERIERALREADHRKDEFLATLGHELRNPLASILTGLELIRLAGLTQPSALRAASVIDRQVNHLVRLVDDLLEVSRITRGIIDVRKEPLDLAAILRAAVDTTKGLLDASQHELKVEIPTRAIPVLGDPVRLTQVFANLLNNAAKYTNTGGHIALTVRTQGQQAIVSVRDDGIGLEPALLSLVFEMFMQVDRANRRTQGGLGIGLTLVRSLVEMHGGTVEARSDGPGTGSEFIVTLPMIAEARTPAPAARTKPTEDFPARRILVVDDNHDAADSLGTLLGALGSEVRVAHSGIEAIEEAERFLPDVILLDIGMPGLDGFEVARQLRTRAAFKETLLIALTGWGQEEDRRRSRAAGFDHHMVKPPNLETLRAHLERRQRPAADVAVPSPGRRLADRPGRAAPA
jgi:signal transduction histidine kinase/CheY-like chemotaxis protein